MMTDQYLPRFWHGPALVGKFLGPLLIGLATGVLVGTSPDVRSALFRFIFISPALLVGALLLFVPGQARIYNGELKFRRGFLWRTIPTDQVACFDRTLWFPAIKLRNGVTLRYFAEVENRSLAVSDLHHTPKPADRSAPGVGSQESQLSIYDALFIFSGAIAGTIATFLCSRLAWATLQRRFFFVRVPHFADKYPQLIVTAAVICVAAVLLLIPMKQGSRWLLSFTTAALVSAQIAGAVMLWRAHPANLNGDKTAALVGAFSLCCAGLLVGSLSLLAPSEIILILARSGRSIDIGSQPIRKAHLRLRIVGGTLVLTSLLLASIVLSALTM